MISGFAAIDSEGTGRRRAGGVEGELKRWRRWSEGVEFGKKGGERASGLIRDDGRERAREHIAAKTSF